MYSWKNIAAVSGLLGGLVVAYAGAAQAYNGGGAGNCTRDAQGNVRCVQKMERTYTSEDGTVHVHQKVDCTSESRNYNYNYVDGRWVAQPQSSQDGGTNCTMQTS